MSAGPVLRTEYFDQPTVVVIDAHLLMTACQPPAEGAPTSVEIVAAAVKRGKR